MPEYVERLADGTLRHHDHADGDSCYHHDTDACTVVDCPCCSFRGYGDA